jgi:GNAT superfamily N-acetyltransferase
MERGGDLGSLTIRPVRPEERATALTFTLRTIAEALALRGRHSPAGQRRRFERRWNKVRNARSSALFFAEDRHGRKAGSLWVGVSRELLDERELGWVYDIHVAREFRGKGVGAKLLRHAVRWATEAGYHTLGLLVDARNSPAVHLYERAGFRPDRYVMYRSLRPARKTGAVSGPRRRSRGRASSRAAQNIRAAPRRPSRAPR